MANWTNLRNANIARTVEWAGEEGIKDYTWRGCELGGEVGEVLSALDAPDLWQKRHSLIASELADCVICIDLTALTLGLPEIPISSSGSIRPGGTIRAHALHVLAPRVLLLQNTLKKLERERRGWPGSRARMEDAERALNVLMGDLGLLASYFGIDLKAATVAKFNETSEKVGLTTRLVGLE